MRLSKDTLSWFVYIDPSNYCFKKEDIFHDDFSLSTFEYKVIIGCFYTQNKGQKKEEKKRRKGKKGKEEKKKRKNEKEKRYGHTWAYSNRQLDIQTGLLQSNFCDIVWVGIRLQSPGSNRKFRK